MSDTWAVASRSRLHSLTPSPVAPPILNQCNRFHEKAGRGQVDSFWFLLVTMFLPPSSHCRHASIRTLEERFGSLGACLAFSVQPVLLSVWRPVVLLLQRETWARRLRQSPELGFGFSSFPSWNGFVFLRGRCYCRSAAVVQRFVHISAHPQVMQQHGQLSRGRHDGSLLAVSPTTFC